MNSPVVSDGSEFIRHVKENSAETRLLVLLVTMGWKPVLWTGRPIEDVADVDPVFAVHHVCSGRRLRLVGFDGEAEYADTQSGQGAERE